MDCDVSHCDGPRSLWLKPKSVGSLMSALEDQGRVKFPLTREHHQKDKISLAAHVKPIGSFADMGVAPPLNAALARISIRAPTEIQAACIPPLLAGLFCKNCRRRTTY